jgi:glutamyl/glutaminyl-tRNA synthetase
MSTAAAPATNPPQKSDPARVVTRFAPSPTGYLHVGGARTALFNWLLARHAGGQFLLRIEDTDLARSTEQATLQLLEDLRWLGLHWDNPQLVYQSRRQEVYNRILEQMIERGQAYKAYETKEEEDALRKQAESRKQTYRYTRPELTDEQVRRYESEGRPHVVRLATPLKEYRFRDAVLGKEIVVGPDQVQDFVIRKADGMPTYHFAVVVDDAEMGVTHILRGQEHTLNTVNHIALQEALGYPRPTYGHLPIILNTDGSKMGKRDRDRKVRHHANLWLKNAKKTAGDLAHLANLAPDRVTQWLEEEGRQLDPGEQQKVMHVVGLREADLPEILVHDFRKNGYLPEVLLNFLALLGWSPGGDRERMTIGEMVALFELQGVNKSNAKFARDKLQAFNTETAASAPTDRLVAAFKDYLSVNPESPLNEADDAMLAKLLGMKKGFRLLREVDETGRFFFVPDERITYEPDAVEKVLRKGNNQGLNALRDVRDVLSSAAEWTAPSLEAAVKAYCERTGLGLGKVAQPIRVAVTGTTVSPPIFESLEFLGRQRTLARIDRCLAAVATG